MLGIALNCLGIVFGTVFGLVKPGRFDGAWQNRVKIFLGAGVAFVGIRTFVSALKGDFRHVFHEIAVCLASLILGKLAGGLIGVQSLSNRVGRYAREQVTRRQAGEGKPNPGEGMNVCAGLFCAAPLAILGPTQDCLGGDVYPLVLKTLLDAAAAISFAEIFGFGVGFSALPVAAFEGGVWMLGRTMEPYLLQHDLLDPIQCVTGFMIFSVSLLILEIRRVQLADYLPSLLIAPLLASFWK